VKRCPKCGEEKPLDAFHRWSKRDGRQVWCKACRKEYDKAYFHANKHRRWPRAGIHAEFLQWYHALKAKPCVDCGGTFPPVAMHWDHRPGTVKLSDVADLARKHARRKVLAEIEKCDLVCANCHAARTDERRRAA
jgi:hypothetical protein